MAVDVIGVLCILSRDTSNHHATGRAGTVSVAFRKQYFTLLKTFKHLFLLHLMKNSSRTTFKKLMRRLGLFVLLPLVVLAAAGLLWLRTSLPGLSENIALMGIDAPVEIIHDGNAIPHIVASSSDDAYRALGFVHARDRLFQMDFMRRLGAGRLSEVTGRPTLRLDKTMRTLGLYRLAEETVKRLPPDARQALDAYAQGVNAFLTARSGALPPEFVVLRYQPEEWTPADSLVWGRLMAMRLTGNWRTEALRAALSARLSPAQLADLWPRSDGKAPPTLASALPAAETARLAAGLMDGLSDWLHQMSASNSWLLSGTGTGTETGKPVLANDPHLGYRAPGLWYLARITAPGLDVTGATAPGVPFHILGHNRRIAWGFTTTDSDTQDLFVERLDPDRPGHYLTPDGSAAFVSRQETIRIKGAPAETFTVRETRHGPVLSDIYTDLDKIAGENEVIALAAASLRADDMTPLALYRFNRAQNWTAFKNAARHFHAPQQNISYADTAGNIGFIAPGRVPVRRSGQGRQPVPGWTGAFDWTGFIPFDALPQTYNPASGRIVNANHRIVPDSYEWYLTEDWSAPYRAERIYQLLDATTPHSVAQSMRIQNGHTVPRGEGPAAGSAAQSRCIDGKAPPYCRTVTRVGRANVARSRRAADLFDVADSGEPGALCRRAWPALSTIFWAEAPGRATHADHTDRLVRRRDNGQYRELPGCCFPRV